MIRVDLDKDAFGWRPPEGMTDKLGNIIEDRVYTGADMNRKLVLERRDEVVAAKITEYLKATNRYDKTIVFCEDIEHAARMRQALSNANADICRTQPQYVVQITGTCGIPAGAKAVVFNITGVSPSGCASSFACCAHAP